MSLLAAILIAGLVAAGITATARTIAQDHKPEWLLEKPLACDLCMSFWGSAASAVWLVAIDFVGGVRAPLVLFGGVGVALLATKAASRLTT